MASNLNRRGLLGLIAAAPMAAVAPREMMPPAKTGGAVGTLKLTIDETPVRERIGALNQAIADGHRLYDLCPATLDGGDGRDFNSFATCQEPPPGGLRAAGHGPDAAHTDRSPIVPPGCDHVAPDAASGPSPSLDQDNEAFLKIARAM